MIITSGMKRLRHRLDQRGYVLVNKHRFHRARGALFSVERGLSESGVLRERVDSLSHQNDILKAQVEGHKLVEAELAARLIRAEQDSQHE